MNKIKNCPVCNKEISIYNKSNAKFNNDYICTKCISLINRHRGKEENIDRINLEDLQNMVKSEKKINTITAIILITILLSIILFFAVSCSNEEEYKCQTKEECEQEEYWKIIEKSQN